MNLYPTTGIPAINTLYVVEGCEHPAAAKLLIRFMMGGIDGDTSGYEPFNTLGGWPVRDDIEHVNRAQPVGCCGRMVHFPREFSEGVRPRH